MVEWEQVTDSDCSLMPVVNCQSIDTRFSNYAVSQSCTTASGAAAAASYFKGSRYVGLHYYSDNTCATLMSSQYYLADGNCISNGQNAYTFTYVNGQLIGHFYPYGDCIGTYTIVDTSTSIGSCSSSPIIQGTYNSWTAVASPSSRPVPTNTYLWIIMLTVLFYL
ncbi:hypothetical protein HDV03_004632 [Kappamyces sp. JEL0829]|nr:hypothetical protein HDV03_004632 [Kappamyces sp. JEL0829]KAJ3343808.1 hypothetical protein HDU91_000338 [Kappamyces sp. JEL0680]